MSPTVTQATESTNYEGFYGLAQSPFALNHDPRFLYLSDSHDAAIQQILRALRRHEPFVVLSGDIGTGKTMLCRALLQQLDRHTFSSLVLNPFLDIEELLRQVLVDFGVVSRDGIRHERFARASKTELTNTLRDFVDTLAPLHAHAVLILDEAQHLSHRVLEELRVLIGAAGGEGSLLQVVFAGQPNLLDVLAGAELTQLDQRISLRALLKPLDKEDVEPYIAHRLAVAGESVSVIFEPNAVKRIHTLSSGVPRVINLLCDRALMAGAARGVHEISPELIDRAYDQMSFRRRPEAVSARRWRPTRRVTIAAAATAVLVGLVALSLSGARAVPLHTLVSAPLPPLPAAPTLPAPRTLVVPTDLLEAPLPPRVARPGTPREIPDNFVAPRVPRP